MRVWVDTRAPQPQVEPRTGPQLWVPALGWGLVHSVMSTEREPPLGRPFPKEADLAIGSAHIFLIEGTNVVRLA